MESKTDDTDSSTDTDHDPTPAPTKTGLRMLWVLAGQARTPEDLQSELAASFATTVSIQTVKRTATALDDVGYVRTASHKHDDADEWTREYVITATGRRVAYRELAGALEHCDASRVMETVGERVAVDALPARKTVLRGEEDLRTDGGPTQTFADHVAEHVSDDPMWSLLSTVTDEHLYSFDPSQSDFAESIDHHVERALTHLHRAQRLRAAEIADELVGTAGNHYVEDVADSALSPENIGDVGGDDQ